MQVKLKVLEGSHAGKEIAIRGSKFLIGRSDECNLRPNSDAISRRHCIIIVSGDVVGIRDLKSRNGTLLNGEKITSDRRLREGDRLRVGPLEFEVLIKSAEVTPAAAGTDKAAVGASSGSGEGAMGGMVSQWLEEADDFAREEQRLAAPETREYRFDETSRIALEAAAEAGNKEASKSQDAANGKESKEDKKNADKKNADKEKKAKAGKPKFAVKGEQPKDTQEAAAQVLRKLFNRG